MVSRTEKNRGRGFFRCPFWKTTDCGYFRWESDLQPGRDESSIAKVGRKGDEVNAVVHHEAILQELRNLKLKVELMDNRLTFVLGTMWVIVLLIAISTVR
ncbi:hypothetical protein LINGRAHAP2_LOCUS31331 [Linum grandiflorum]